MKKDDWFGVILIASLTFLLLIGYVGFCYFESTTFNKLTGARTTVFDALWVELRVDCQNIK